MSNESYEFTVIRVNNVVERKTAANWSMKNMVTENSYVMVFTLEGECTYTFAGKTMLTKANDVYIFEPGIVRSAITNPDNPWFFISVNFDAADLNGAPCALPASILKLTSDASPTIKAAFASLHSTWIKKEVAYSLNCRTLVQDIIGKLIVRNNQIVPASPHHKVIIAAQKYIQNNYTSPIIITDLIQQSGLSSAQFRKLFREFVGLSPSQYAIFLRLNKARSLLESGEVNISETAYLCGFSDVFYFSRLFKMKMGVSPMKLIKRGSS